jgi:hypothetical protein
MLVTTLSSRCWQWHDVIVESYWQCHCRVDVGHGELTLVVTWRRCWVMLTMTLPSRHWIWCRCWVLLIIALLRRSWPCGASDRLSCSLSRPCSLSSLADNSTAEVKLTMWSKRPSELFGRTSGFSGQAAKLLDTEPQQAILCHVRTWHSCMLNTTRACQGINVTRWLVEFPNKIG